MTRWREAWPGVCLALMVAWPVQPAAASVPAGTAVVFVAHDITIGQDAAPRLRHWAYNRITSKTAADGATRLQIRPLWTQPRWRGGRGSHALDPAYADDRALRDVLATGFDLLLPGDGQGTILQAADPVASQALSERGARYDTLAAAQLEALGWRPVDLPARLAVGQQLVRRDRNGDFAPIETRLQVRAIDDAVVLLDLAFEGDRLHGHGRQAVRRHDGQPLETRLYLLRGSDPAQPATTHRLHLVDMSIEPALDLELEDAQPRGMTEVFSEMLARPPFSAPSDDPAHFTLHPVAEGALETWMLPKEALPGIEDMLLFGLQSQHEGGRPLITIGAHSPTPQPADTQPLQLAWLRVRGVTLRDPAGQPLPGVDATVVQPRLVMHDRQRVQEGQAQFPFRLPIDLQPSALGALDSIETDVTVSTYAWDRAETVARRTQSIHNPDARITWTSPRRVTLVQPNSTPGQLQGQWTTVVPVDASGREIPYAQVVISSALEVPGDWRTPETMPKLRRESDYVPQRQEIATATPIAALRLRHYTWQALPQTWTFRDMRTRMTDAEREAYEQEFR